MATDTNTTETSTSTCGVGREGIKCAVVSWVMPLAAMVVLVIAMRYPAIGILNLLFIAFGITAVLRSVAHIRLYGSCGLGGHLAAGISLNIAVLVLIAIYIFTSLDPFNIR